MIIELQKSQEMENQTFQASKTLKVGQHHRKTSILDKIQEEKDIN